MWPQPQQLLDSGGQSSHSARARPHLGAGVGGLHQGTSTDADRLDFVV